MPTSGARERDGDLADERYQAPFSRAAVAIDSSKETEDAADNGVLAPSSVASSYFDEKELRDARAWVREGCTPDTSSEVPPEPEYFSRPRRDSQVGGYDDRDTIFDGPSAEFVPSSVSSMHHAMSRPSFQSYMRRQRSSTSGHRRGRASSSVRSHSVASRDASPSSMRTESGVSHPASVISYRKRDYRRGYRGSGEGENEGDALGGSSSLIGSLFASFRGDASNFGDRMEERDATEWSESAADMYEDELDDMDDDDDEVVDLLDSDSGSERSSRRSEAPHSPTSRLLPQVFGEADGFYDPRYDAREEGEVPFDDPALGQKPVHLKDHPEVAEQLLSDGGAPDAAPPAAADPLSEEAQRSSVWLDKSCRSKQQIYLMDEDTMIRVSGYRTRQVRRWLFLLLSVLTLGVAGLLSLWFPRWRLRHIYEEAEFADAEFVVVESQWGDLSTMEFISVPFARPLNSVFPPTSRDPPCTHAEAQAMLHDDCEVPPTEADDEIVDLVMFEYRYTRFLLHPPSGRFRTIKDWRDPTWTSLETMQRGIRSELQHERRVFFGDNVIEIAGKSTTELLVGEVLHPFYIFQIVSIALWSLDDYYYYAFCIAAISVGSILSTLVETKKTIARMREMNHFVCTVRVLRDQAWVSVDSSELVPGDVYDAADGQLAVLPADSVLLSGDAIVNESMLTGESVPISKQPVTSESLAALSSSKSDMSQLLAKHFLFAGTKVIRIRPTLASDSDEVSAKAMVVRTGFNTTKGSLVRGMLFPKPVGFKFYVRTVTDAARFVPFYWLSGVHCAGRSVLQHGELCAAGHCVEHAADPCVGLGDGCRAACTARDDEHRHCLCDCAAAEAPCVLHFAVASQHGR